ncbi:MAG: MarR family transcriptional regulator [Cellulosilyticaceae bacterium]
MKDKVVGPENLSPQQFVFGALFIIANKLQVNGDRWDEHITMKQWLLVVMITQFREGAPKLSEVADFMGVSRQNIKQLALKLQKKGFITLQKDEKDSRALRIHLTAYCEAYFKGREVAEQMYLGQLYEGFTEEDMSGLYRGICRLLLNIQKMETSREDDECGEDINCV